MFYLVSCPMNEKIICLGICFNIDAEEIIDLELSIVLGILGIAITIFTVIYSFVGSKLQQKKIAERKLHIATNPDPYLKAELKFIRMYIKRNKRMNSIIIKIIYYSLLLAFVLILNKLWNNTYIFGLSQICSIIYVGVFIMMLIYYIHIYNKEVG